MPRKPAVVKQVVKQAAAEADRATAPGAQPTAFPVDSLPPAVVTVHTPLTLIEVAEAADLDALLADARVASLVVARLSPTAAVALPDKARALLDALRKAGHTPKVSGE